MYSWLEKWQGNKPPTWQRERIDALLSELDPLGRGDEEKFLAIRDREVQACYDHEVSDSSIKNNFTHIRKAIAIFYYCPPKTMTKKPTPSKFPKKVSLSISEETKQAFHTYQEKIGVRTQDEALQTLLAQASPQETEKTQDPQKTE
jgi:hypothetical protein